jgi:hypothetical protein
MSRRSLDSTRPASDPIWSWDVPPQDVFCLLTDTWHVHPHLATALVNHFGGHISFISQAIGDVALKKEKYRPLYPLTEAPSFSGNVERCIFEGGKEIIPKLQVLAESGFLAMTSSDLLGELIAKHNVGGFVPEGAEVVIHQ